MSKPDIRVRYHYSGLLIGHCAEDPELVVMASDHDELASLMEQALASRAEGRTVEALLDQA